jgi:hypothetical protein
MPDSEPCITDSLSELTGKDHGLIVYRSINLAVYCCWEGVVGIPQGSQAGYLIVGDRLPFKADTNPETVPAAIAQESIRGLRIVDHPGAEHMRAAMEQAVKDGGKITIYTIDIVKVMVFED